MSDNNVQEQVMTVRVPNPTDDKSFHIMKYNASIKMDLSSWSQVRMVRENNQKYINTHQTEETPKFGAGSAFGKDAKEEARRKKLGIVSRKYRSEAQPWLLKVGGKTGKKYRGVREGGITNNTTYYVFTHGNDGVVSAYPISEWYNFTPIMRYKTLDVDEAEEKFAQRGKILNKWSVMVNKKVKTGGEEAEGEEPEEETGKKGKGGGGKKDFKVSDMDEWDEDDDAFASSGILVFNAQNIATYTTVHIGIGAP
jgi:transcription initiation factor TFIIF subunit alpha